MGFKLKTNNARKTIIWVVVVSILLVLCDYFVFTKQKDFFASIIYGIKFSAFLLASYSFLQNWGRPREIQGLRNDLAEVKANLSNNKDDEKALEKLKDIREQIANVKADKEVGERFMLISIILTLGLSLFGKA
ncbi:TPA: hypothetical protein NG563_004528 [Vibrio parahaemolyticus]|nr:hypothetical protein [Vibrio parahaemolyticus]HCE3309634.1 hypothetical protein [Vibrio parahaemolyticus]